MKSLYNISQDAGEFANSPAMQLIRKGREEAWAEAQQKIEEARQQEAQARKKEAQARQKEAQARQKAEAEKKSAIRKMLKAEMDKTLIADFLGLTLKKLEAYVREIQQEDSDSSKG